MTGFIHLNCVQAQEASAALPAAKAAAAKAAAAVAPSVAPAPAPAQAHDASLQVDFEPEEHEEAPPQPKQSRPAQPLPKTAQPLSSTQWRPKAKVQICSLHELLCCKRTYVALSRTRCAYAPQKQSLLNQASCALYINALHLVQHNGLQHVSYSQKRRVSMCCVQRDGVHHL